MLLNYKKSRPFVYIIVCKDLKPRQIVVQSCHAALESGIHQEHCKDFPSGLIMLQVSNEEALLGAKKKLDSKKIKYKLFWEKPMERYTALATEAIPQNKRYLMREFKLLSMAKLSIWQKIKSFLK